MNNIQEKVQRHLAFWNRYKVDRPMVGFQIGTYFFADRFKAARNLMVPGKEIKPADIYVDDFLDDYEKLYQQITQVEQDAFWTACPFISVPWFEAILGCKIKALKSSMASEPYLKDLNHLENLFSEKDNLWLDKFLEFTEKLVELSRNRFPVGQPIMRGLSDTMGALRGHSDFVLDLYDYPEESKKLLKKIKEIFMYVMNKQQKILKEYHGGYSVALFNQWAPGKCFYIQEDLSILLSPNIYRRYIYDLDKMICEDKNYDYCTFHIHAASFFILDDLLKIDNIKAYEITKDVGGASIKEMIPQLEKILNSKRLILWGDLNYEDLDIILDNLPYNGLYLHIVSESVIKAKQLMDYIKNKSAKNN